MTESSVLEGNFLPSLRCVSIKYNDSHLFKEMGLFASSNSTGTGFSEFLLHRHSYQASKFRTAHVVLLSVFLGTKPLL